MRGLLNPHKDLPPWTSLGGDFRPSDSFIAHPWKDSAAPIDGPNAARVHPYITILLSVNEVNKIEADWGQLLSLVCELTEAWKHQ